MSLKDAIKEAAKGLDHKKVDDWQEDGRPSLKRIHQLAKTTAITQEQLDDALPDLRRNQQSGGPATSTPEAGKPAATANASTSPAKAGNSATDTKAIKDASMPEKKKAEDDRFVENTLVVATELGYYGSKLREIGEKFYFTGRIGNWMEKANAAERKQHAEERANG